MGRGGGLPSRGRRPHHPAPSCNRPVFDRLLPKCGDLVHASALQAPAPEVQPAGMFLVFRGRQRLRSCPLPACAHLIIHSPARAWTVVLIGRLWWLRVRWVHRLPRYVASGEREWNWTVRPCFPSEKERGGIARRNLDPSKIRCASLSPYMLGAFVCLQCALGQMLRHTMDYRRPCDGCGITSSAVETLV